MARMTFQSPSPNPRAAGAITFHLTELGGDVELRAGERLELPAGTMHAATVGSAGVTCLEEHLPAGSLTNGLRHLIDR